MLWESQLSAQHSDELLKNVPLPSDCLQDTLFNVEDDLAANHILNLRDLTFQLTNTPFGPGAVVDKRFQLESIIGRGSMTIVYRAYDMENDNNFVVVKICAPLYKKKTPERILAFTNGGEINRLLTTDRFPELISTGMHYDCEFIANEYIRGVSLDRILHNFPQGFEIEPACDIAIQSCYALQDLSAFGLVHRDIKPSNFMLSRDGKVKLLDFDLICYSEDFVEQEVDPLRTTGTIWYMSPEQCFGGRVSAGSDIYSLGVTLYLLLTSQFPFKYDCEHEMKSAHLTEIPVDPREHRPEIPDEFSAIILKALAKASDERFLSAGEMRLALERVRHNLALQSVNGR